jgi:hypothetical protein
MFRSIRRHVSYANVVATMALVFAMGGSAIAARHYLITNTTQIKPSVLKSLKGRAGPKGATGLQGVQGKEGAPGKGAPTVLQSGKTEIGTYSAWGAGDPTVYVGASVTFQTPLSGALDGSHVKFVPRETSGAPNCPGTAAAPTALSGYLCVYETVAAAATYGGEGIFPQSTGSGNGSDPYGFGIYFAAAAGGDFDYGTWAVTAP